MYTSRAIGRKWTCENLYNDTHLYTRSVDLDRNLIGDVGKIKVSMTELGKDLYIGFSGTQDAEFWLYNIDGDVVTTPVSLYGTYYDVHEGFYDLADTAFQEALTHSPDHLKKFNQYQNIIFTGHSAGGAVAALMPILLRGKYEVNNNKMKVIDFGSPRVWANSNVTTSMVDGQTLAKEYPFERIRFQHVYDLVPCAPLHWRGPLAAFSHTGDVRWTTSHFKVLPKAPWLRIPRMLWEYSSGVARNALKFHSSHQYSSTVLANYFREDSNET
jgi:predicted lipase